MASAVAFRYARALVDVVTSPRSQAERIEPAAVTGQLTAFEELLEANTELRIVLNTPAIAGAKKIAVLDQIASLAGLSPTARNFLTVVLKHERIGLLKEIIEAYQALLNERLGIVVAEITSARSLEEPEKEQLARALGAKTGKRVQMKFSLDPSLISGVVARIGSTIYDGSIRGQLERLRSELTGAAAPTS